MEYCSYDKNYLQGKIFQPGKDDFFYRKQIPFISIFFYGEIHQYPIEKKINLKNYFLVKEVISRILKIGKIFLWAFKIFCKMSNIF